MVDREFMIRVIITYYNYLFYILFMQYFFYKNCG